MDWGTPPLDTSSLCHSQQANLEHLARERWRKNNERPSLVRDILPPRDHCRSACHHWGWPGRRRSILVELLPEVAVWKIVRESCTLKDPAQVPPQRCSRWRWHRARWRCSWGWREDGERWWFPIAWRPWTRASAGKGGKWGRWRAGRARSSSIPDWMSSPWCCGGRGCGWQEWRWRWRRLSQQPLLAEKEATLNEANTMWIDAKVLLKKFSIEFLLADSHLYLCVRVEQSQEAEDDEGKKDLGEVQSENPSGHMLHPVQNWRIRLVACESNYKFQQRIFER